MELIPVAAEPLSPSTDQSTRNTQKITLTGAQLQRALYWAMPDGDPEHLEAEVTIGWSDGVKSDDEELAIAPGYVLWWSDYPEEGCVPLDEPPPGAALAMKHPVEDRAVLAVPGEVTSEFKSIGWVSERGEAAVVYSTEYDAQLDAEADGSLFYEVFQRRTALAQQSDFRGLETGEGPQGDAATEQSSGASTS